MRRAPSTARLLSTGTLACVLLACGAAPARTAEPPSNEPTVVAAAPPSFAAYRVPSGEGVFDVIARDDGVRVYAALTDGAARTLARFDLDLEGRPARAAAIELAREPLALESSSIAVAAIDTHDLAVVCDLDDEGGAHYAALWIDAAGAVTERVDLGTFPAEDDVEAPCFLSVAPSGPASAIVIHGRDSLACPRRTSDDELVQCPGYRGVALAPTRAPEDLIRVGTLDALPVLVGTTRGWAWGLGPYAIRGSIVVNTAGMSNTPLLLDATTVEGFLANDDTLVALGMNDANDALVATALRDGTVLTGEPSGQRPELPSIEAELVLTCIDGAVGARVRTSAFTMTVRAGERSASIPWRLLIPNDLPGPTSAPQGGFATASGRVFHTTFDGELEIVSCDGDVLSTRATAWRAEE